MKLLQSSTLLEGQPRDDCFIAVPNDVNLVELTHFCSFGSFSTQGTGFVVQGLPNKLLAVADNHCLA